MDDYTSLSKAPPSQNLSARSFVYVVRVCARAVDDGRLFCVRFCKCRVVVDRLPLHDDIVQ